MTKMLTNSSPDVLLPMFAEQTLLPSTAENSAALQSTSTQTSEQRILLSSPHMSDEGYELEYVYKAFETNWLAPVGENINHFEQELADYVGIDNAAAVQSGTSAIHLALKGLNIQPGDIVFVQSLTFAASMNPILYEKAIPVLIDSERETWNMDPEMLEKAFQKYQPKAVIVVHLYGNIANMRRIKEICEKYNTPIIEDAAESLGSVYEGQHSGTFGDYGIFSFNGNKIITTTSGGMLVSNNKAGIDRALFIATQAKEPVPYYYHTEVGYNYRMSNVLAGIGRGQLKVLENRVAAKQRIYRIYKEAFEDVPEITMMPTHDGANNWLSCILLNSKHITPIMLMEVLEKHNIESRLVWKPMHQQPVSENFDYIGQGVSDDIFKRGLCLPSDTKMTNKEIVRVITLIRSFLLLNRFSKRLVSE